MNFEDPAVMMALARVSRAASRLIVSNGVFALMMMMLLFGSLTLQLARDHSVSGNGAPAHGE